MRGKRSKQYRKLMNQYELAFNFREPYQVLVDADMVRDTCRMKMDLESGFKRTLHGLVKPMITTCSIRHLYTANDQDAVTIAKSFERRRCNHHTLEEPLAEIECIKSVVDPNGRGTNKFRYVVASQSYKLRALMREILGVPLVYVKKSVMIMEPMAERSEDERVKEERSKFKLGLKVRTGARSLLGKRGRDEGDEVVDQEDQNADVIPLPPSPKRRRKGPKEPNPLSVRKPKQRESEPSHVSHQQNGDVTTTTNGSTSSSSKRKRKRKSTSRTQTDLTEVSVTSQ